MEEMNDIYIPVMLPATFVQPIEQTEESVIQVTEEKPIEIIGEPLVAGHVTILKCLMDGAIFKEITKSITALTPEVRLHITTEGITARCVDTANVAMVAIDYKKDIFEGYSIRGDNYQIGIDLTIWSKFLKNIKKGSLVLFEVVQKELPLKPLTEKQKESGKDDRVIEYEYFYTIACNGTTQTGKTLDVNTIRRDPNPPAITLKTHIELYALDLIETVKSAHDVSDKIVFEYALIPSEKEFKSIAEGSTSKSVKIINTLSITGDKACSLFSIAYLLDIVKAIQNKKEVISIDLGWDHPIKINLSNDMRTITYLLAPRIEA